MPTVTLQPVPDTASKTGLSWDGGDNPVGTASGILAGDTFALWQALWTVPAGVDGIVTQVVVRINHSASAAVTLGSAIAFGAPSWDQDILTDYSSGGFSGEEDTHTLSTFIPTLATGVYDLSSLSVSDLPAFSVVFEVATSTYSVSSLELDVTYTAAVTIDPGEGSSLGGTPVTITGTDFVADSTVAFDGLPATSVVVVSDTEITCVTPAHAIGAVSFTVTAPDLSPAGSGTFTYIELTVDPVIGTTFGGTVVELTGVTIPPDSTATLDGVPVTLIFGGGTVTFVTPGHSPTEVEILVTFPDTQVYSGTFHFYIFPSFTPPGGPPAGGTLVSIHRWYFEADDGTEFIPGATITFDGTPATDITFIDVDNYTCKTPAHAPGFVDVVISNISSLGLVMEYPNEFAYGLTLKAPFINAGPDKVARGPAPSTVHVVATTDAVSASYLWEQTGGPQAVTISSPASLSTDLVFPTYVPGVYTFRIKALLSDLPYISDSMNVKIPVLYPPKIMITGTS